METKPCPFCQNPNAEDVGDACCFCDYEGTVKVGKNGMFDTIEQYNKVYQSSNHKERLESLHSLSDKNIQGLK